MDGQNELLIIFNSLIQKYGGREKLINSIECEWMKPIKGKAAFKWTKDSTQYLVNGFHKLSIERMAQVLNVTYRVIDSKISQLKQETDLLGKHRKPHVHTDEYLHSKK